MEQQRAKEEESALEKELDSQRKKVAELETRIEELTIMSQVRMYILVYIKWHEFSLLIISTLLRMKKIWHTTETSLTE